MSFMNDVDIYKKMVSEEIVPKTCPIDENSTEFMEIRKCEHIEESLVVGEEIVVDENMDLNQQVLEENVCEKKEPILYYEENMDSDEKVVEYAEATESLSIDHTDREKWITDDTDKHSLVLPKLESQSEVCCTEIAHDDQDGDEETIATFVTAAGQQLALYAVEDSEEIFAVAVYDESGEPPTNFQFLMKADVERLIGEGAVRTVKKPTQIKKQLLTTQPPTFFSKPESMHHLSVNNTDQKLMPAETQRTRQKRNSWNENSSLVQEPDLNLDIKPVPNIIYTTANKQSDVTYVMMDDCPVNIDQSEDCQEEVESDGEFVEQSTVQYILFDGDQSDSELTFDEIQSTLQKMKNLESKTLAKKSLLKKTMRDENDLVDTKQTEFEYHHNLNSALSNHTSSTLSERQLNLMSSRQELIETLSDPMPDTASESAKLNISNGSVDCTSPESTQTRFKAKRSRKQQLTSVNREDTEIIIQPASLLTEEENNVRKRGKRKKRVVPHSGYHQRNTESKRIKKVKHKEVEVIEIDVDEEETMKQAKRAVVEITIDDSKDKYSSDKENEIIMVGDSDDESQQSDAKTTLLQCQHCSRSFRQQRALETHLRVCSKSPSNSVKFNEQKLKNANSANENGVKKQYACKICQQIFDVVVALARHVRSEHSQRKKRRFSKSSVEREPEEIVSPETRKTPLPVVSRVKRKKVQRSNCTWEVKKLSCTDCGRWFPSAALLRAHCLQHGTKKSEQQIRRCQICKKLIKSRLLFIRHLKKHGNVQQNTRSGANIQKKLHTTRSVTRKITSLRKRGRPRKL